MAHTRVTFMLDGEHCQICGQLPGGMVFLATKRR